MTTSADRLAFFSDGVFAIAATLLVLDLTARSLGDIATDADLWNALVANAASFLSFAVSFLLLCLLWMLHVWEFRWIERTDTGLMWFNAVRLLFVVLVPFTTSVNSEYNELMLGRMLLPINFLLACLAAWAEWLWASRPGAGLLSADLSEDDARALSRGGLSAVLICVAIVPLSALVGSWAFVLFALDGPLTKLMRGRKRLNATEPDGAAAP
jgi:uncharacterized membrane protein